MSKFIFCKKDMKQLFALLFLFVSLSTFAQDFPSCQFQTNNVAHFKQNYVDIDWHITLDTNNIYVDYTRVEINQTTYPVDWQETLQGFTSIYGAYRIDLVVDTSDECLLDNRIIQIAVSDGIQTIIYYKE